jgi:hypothetical protein
MHRYSKRWRENWKDLLFVFPRLQHHFVAREILTPANETKSGLDDSVYSFKRLGRRKRLQCKNYSFRFLSLLLLRRRRCRPQVKRVAR